MSIKISELPEATAIGNDDLLAIVQEGSTKKITFGNAIGKAQQITVIKQNNSTTYHLDENFTTQLSIPLTEGIYYNDTKPTEGGTIRIITGFENDTYSYTTIPYRSYIVVYPVEKYVWMIDDEHYYYKFLVVTAGETRYLYGGYLKDTVDIRSYMVEAFVGEWANRLTCVEHDIENTANKVTSIDDSSTDLQYPSAKAVQDKYNVLLDQIPTATATGETINVQDSSNLPPKDFAMLGNATQDGTPTPDTPQDIHVVTGDNTVKVLGKNLFNAIDKAETTKNGIKFSISNQTFHVNGTNSNSGSTWTENMQLHGMLNTNKVFEIGKTYTISYVGTMSEGTYLAINYYDTSTGSQNGLASLNYNNTSRTVTVPNTFGGVAQVFIGVLSGTATSNCEFKVQIEKDASNVSPYEPYTEATQLISLGSIELAKIGDYTDRIFKQDGKWYVEKNTQKLNMTDISADVSVVTSYQSNFNSTNGIISLRLRKAIFSKFNLPQDTAISYGYCNSLSRSPGQNLWNTTNQLYHFGYTDGLLFGVNYTDLGLESWTSGSIENLGNKLDTNFGSTFFYLPLATPTTTEITDTTLIAQLENVLKMHTNKNVTNAWIEPSGTNAQAGLILTYYRDLQTITDKIDSLEARVSLLE